MLFVIGTFLLGIVWGLVCLGVALYSRFTGKVIGFD